MVGIISIANGSGRFFGHGYPTLVGGMVFLAMFLFRRWPFFSFRDLEFRHLSLLAFVVLLCYGGGFGTMPAFAADYFGSRDVGPIYGLMLTAWGFAGVAGPALIAHVRQSTGEYHGALRIMALLTLLSAVVPLLLRRPSVTPLVMGGVEETADS